MRHSWRVVRSAGPLGIAILAVALAGCGSDDGDDSSDSRGDSADGSGIVSTSEVSDVGTVLVDRSGQTLYFADEEADGSIQCVDACLGFWTPAEATGDLPSDIDGLDTVTRDDNGVEQLTLDGAPLYTFTLDKEPGEVTGDDLTDSFGGTSFTWHAAVTEASDSGDDGSDGGGGGYVY